MKPLSNPFAGKSSFRCFGCAPSNPHGLHMTFFLDGEDVVCLWDPSDAFQGWNHVLHGGIQSTLADETAAWLVMAVKNTAGVTSRLEVRYKKPVYTNRGIVEIRARLADMNRNVALIDVEIRNSDGEVCTEARVDYYTFTREKAGELLDYPGAGAFLGES